MKTYEERTCLRIDWIESTYIGKFIGIDFVAHPDELVLFLLFDDDASTRRV